MIALMVRWIMPIVGVLMILGFSYKWPDAHPCGAMFFVGGWLLLGLEQLAWHLRKSPKAQL